MNNGWIKLHRELFTKPIWLNSTAEQKVILITLLGMVNSAPKEWEWKGEKYVCEAGQCITSLANIAQKCGNGISIKNIRSALVRFEKLEFLANASTKQGRLITILNWSNYQGDDYKGGKGTGKEVAKDWQRGGKEVATNKNNKKDKKDKKNNIYSPAVAEIVDHLNMRTGSQYKHTSKKTQDLIRARMNEGFTAEDFITVIDKKCVEWMNTEWQQYLRPETLFSTKFEGYLNAPVKPQSTGNKFADLIASGRLDG